MVNAAFMKPCAAVIETFGYGYVLPQFFGNLAADTGKLYFPICSSPACVDSDFVDEGLTRTCEHGKSNVSSSDCHDMMNGHSVMGLSTAHYFIDPSALVEAVRAALSAQKTCIQRARNSTILMQSDPSRSVPKKCEDCALKAHSEDIAKEKRQMEKNIRRADKSARA